MNGMRDFNILSILVFERELCLSSLLEEEYCISNHTLACEGLLPQGAEQEPKCEMEGKFCCCQGQDRVRNPYWRSQSLHGFTFDLTSRAWLSGCLPRSHTYRVLGVLREKKPSSALSSRVGRMLAPSSFPLKLPSPFSA